MHTVTKIYRGIRWVMWPAEYTTVEGTMTLGAYAMLNDAEVTAEAGLTTLSFDEVIAQRWPSIVDWANRAGLTAVDQIPWEIHLIEDETAHHAAVLAAETAILDG